MGLGAQAEPPGGPTDEEIQTFRSPFPLGQRQGALGWGEIPAASWCWGKEESWREHGAAPNHPAPQGEGPRRVFEASRGQIPLLPKSFPPHPAPSHLPARARSCCRCRTRVSGAARARLHPSSAAEGKTKKNWWPRSQRGAGPLSPTPFRGAEGSGLRLPAAAAAPCWGARRGRPCRRWGSGSGAAATRCKQEKVGEGA